ncbi:CDP-glycerol glycerophosphotransferase family protein, partial [Porcipelethomonas sp.]|uniref:CDP-glycerol glycerophosphotransferase family protein n=1 Tax=Porcipelethomonas sp. TaxID=2981675 RepID=UPI00307ACBEC
MMILKDIVKKIPFLRKILKKLYLNNRSADYEKISNKCTTDSKLVVFESYQGRSYSCSPKAIYQYMLSCPKFSGYSYVWVFRDINAHGSFPQNTRLV